MRSGSTPPASAMTSLIRLRRAELDALHERDDDGIRPAWREPHVPRLSRSVWDGTASTTMSAPAAASSGSDVAEIRCGQRELGQVLVVAAGPSVRPSQAASAEGGITVRAGGKAAGGDVAGSVPVALAPGEAGLRLRGTGSYRKQPVRIDLRTTGVLDLLADGKDAVTQPVRVVASIGQFRPQLQRQYHRPAATRGSARTLHAGRTIAGGRR